MPPRARPRWGGSVVARRPTKYVFVTGGVVSSLGKGITAASLGRLLKARGLKVQVQKFDPYINVDPGTMSPFQHGEVFVTEDGAETDLDIGHYERFIDENLSRNVEPHRRRDLGRGAPQGAQGRVPRLDRAGDPAHHERDQGADPQRDRRQRLRRRRSPRSAAPSATSSRCRSSRRSASSGARPAPRTSATSTSRSCPFIESAGELKTKPTQHSVNELRRIGIHPDIIVARSRDPISRRHPREDRAVRRPRPERGDRQPRRPRPLPRARRRCRRRASTGSSARSSGCREPTARARRVARADRAHPRSARGRGRDRARRQVREAPRRVPLGARGAQARGRPPRLLACACAGSTPRGCRSRRPQAELEQVDGVLVPGGFGSRGWEGKILACRVARERGIPYLGICLGMHVAVSRVRAPRGRARGRQLDRDGSRDAVSR